MRVEKPLTLAGKFWLPASPEHTVVGSLTIQDGGKIRLETVGRVEPPGLNRGSDMIPRILGQIVEHGLVTLEDCFYERTSFNSTGIPALNSLYVRVAILGVTFNAGEQALFDDIRFSFEGLDEWIDMTGMSVKLESEPRSAHIDYRPLTKFEVWRDPNFTLSCEFEWTAPFHVQKRATISQTAYLRLRASAPSTLDRFMELLHPIGHLISFGLDETVSLKSVTGYADALVKHKGKKYEQPYPMPIYVEALQFNTVSPDIKEVNRLFTLKKLPGSSQDAFAIWFALHGSNSSAMNLFFSTRKAKFEYLNVPYLLIAQAVESFHRNFSPEKLMADEDFKELKKSIEKFVAKEHRVLVGEKLLHGNELSLAKRLSRLMDPFSRFFSEGPGRAASIQSIVVTRNYYTHWSKPKDGADIDGLSVWQNLQRLDILLQLSLLLVLGFSHEQIDRITDSSYSMQRRMHLLGPVRQSVDALPNE